jgi:hypothetical protein
MLWPLPSPLLTSNLGENWIARWANNAQSAAAMYKQVHLPGRSEAIRRPVKLGLKVKAK